MESRAEVDAIRVVSVSRDGSNDAFSSLCTKLGRLGPNAFVAIDTEFSGLGRDPALRTDNLQTRYDALRRLADTCAIFSVGVSVFDPVADAAQTAEPRTPQYAVSTYDLLMSCQDEFRMCPKSGEFLVSHSFDFNRMFQAGIPYFRASTAAPAAVPGAAATATGMPLSNNDATPPPSSTPAEYAQTWQWAKMPRGLLWRIGRHGVPLVVHNGLFDLVFLYAAFQAPLPPTLNGFVASLLDCLPAGVWDSKVVAAGGNNRASFLAYLFAKAVMQHGISVHTASGMPSNEVTDPPHIASAKSRSHELCPLFAFRGFCPRGLQCMFSHDSFKVIDEEKAGNCAADSKTAYARHRTLSKSWKRLLSEANPDSATDTKMNKKQRKRIRMQQKAAAEAAAAEKAATNGDGRANLVVEPKALDSKVVDGAQDDTNSDAAAMDVETSDALVTNQHEEHTAGWDAFCTGYIFAGFRATLTPEKLQEDHNRIALTGKLSNLLLRRSEYASLDEMTTEPAQENASDAKDATANVVVPEDEIPEDEIPEDVGTEVINPNDVVLKDVVPMDEAPTIAALKDAAPMDDAPQTTTIVSKQDS